MSKEEIPTGEELTDSNDEYLVNEDLSLDQEKLASAHKRSERLLDILSLGINGLVAVILILLIVVTLVRIITDLRATERNNGKKTKSSLSQT